MRILADVSGTDQSDLLRSQQIQFTTPVAQKADFKGIPADCVHSLKSKTGKSSGKLFGLLTSKRLRSQILTKFPELSLDI